jgi:hypothetical protein
MHRKLLLVGKNFAQLAKFFHKSWYDCFLVGLGFGALGWGERSRGQFAIALFFRVLPRMTAQVDIRLPLPCERGSFITVRFGESQNRGFEGDLP